MPSSCARSSHENCRLGSLCCPALSIILCKVKFPKAQSHGGLSSASLLLFWSVCYFLTTFPFFLFLILLTLSSLQSQLLLMLDQYTNNCIHPSFCLLMSKEIWLSLRFNKLFVDYNLILRPLHLCIVQMQAVELGVKDSLSFLFIQTHILYYVISEKGVWQTDSVLCTVLWFLLYTQTDTCFGTSVKELVPNYPLFSK